jgi:GIY-YIG catalytic domain-containing protein
MGDVAISTFFCHCEERSSRRSNTCTARKCRCLSNSKFQRPGSYYVYIMTKKNINGLHTGVTNNLSRRAWEHKSKLIEGFTKNIV